MKKTIVIIVSILLLTGCRNDLSTGNENVEAESVNPEDQTTVDYDLTQKYYFYCVIQDATACCAQGLEFVWDDGTHVYPDEYPEDNAEVIIEGTFETYREEEDASLYCRLADATLEKYE